MSTLADHTASAFGLRSTLTLAHSALPDAPVVPDTPRTSLFDRARLIVVAASRRVSRPAPDVAKDPAMAQG